MLIDREISPPRRRPTEVLRRVGGSAGWKAYLCWLTHVSVVAISASSAGDTTDAPMSSLLLLIDLFISASPLSTRPTVRLKRRRATHVAPLHITQTSGKVILLSLTFFFPRWRCARRFINHAETLRQRRRRWASVSTSSLSSRKRCERAGGKAPC